MSHFTSGALTRSVLGRGQQAWSAADEDLAAPEDGHEDAHAEHEGVITLVGHAGPVPLVVAIIGRCHLVVGADATCGRGSAGKHKDEANKVANAEAPVADGANVSRPEEACAESENEEVDCHDDAPGSIPGPNERPAGTSLVARLVGAASIDPVDHSLSNLFCV